MKSIVEWFKEDWPHRRQLIPITISAVSVSISSIALVILVLKLQAK